MQNQIPELRKRIEKLQKKFNRKKSPLCGNDIMEYFCIEPGPEVGKLLKNAIDLWLEHPNWNKEKILSNLYKNSSK